MINIYEVEEKKIEKIEVDEIISSKTYWYDLLNPHKQELVEIEEQFQIELPSYYDMQDLEQSELTYIENGAIYICSTTIHKNVNKETEKEFIAFVIKDNVLISIRYADLISFKQFIRLAHPELKQSPASAFACLFDLILERIASVTSIYAKGVSELSETVFAGEDTEPKKDLTKLFYEIGKNTQNISNLTEAITSLRHATNYAKKYLPSSQITAIKNATTDIGILYSHIGFLEEKMYFLQESVLGLINIEQNRAISILSLLSVIFLPPTMIASIYGMNFHFMPELEWEYGYFFVIGAMILSVIILFGVLKHKKLL